ncbi:MAG: 1,4-alpha-glucan branching protein GlgB [Methanomicrobiales archaeon]|jgi:1,4-alpha-glucan branching enzyme|nr:1,4-alpha-glucan branching protein GlgB [Methanomicrobiales archaeon]
MSTSDDQTISDYDIYLFREGNHCWMSAKLGSHRTCEGGEEGFSFAVWAPNAAEVSVLGDFNGWDRERHPLTPRKDGSGIFSGFVPGVRSGALYKYSIWPFGGGVPFEKSDPYANRWETPPGTASMVWDLSYDWRDAAWMASRGPTFAHNAPVSIYEVHLGSWRRVPEEGNRYLTYRESAHALADYLGDHGFSHVELLPVNEHPYYGSWGYQVLGYFAPTSRYGTPQDFMYFIDHLHQHGIGVIMDWVPSHFPADPHGLAAFDGTPIYEHPHPARGVHPEWGSLIFDYGRGEVASFLLSSAVFWLDRYHIDGIRVDAVASMLYLDYARREGEWHPNQFGGKDNIEAIRFIRKLNEMVYGIFPDVHVIAEESTAWALVTSPTYSGGLGFGMKWNMGWMHDTLQYFMIDPVYRKFHHDDLTFSILYAFSENFVLALSHDEVVHGKGSLLGKMYGDAWQKFAGLRLLLGLMYAHPGKKLLFMGSEFGQWREWSHESSLDWNLLSGKPHAGVLQWVTDLNHLYRQERALHALDFDPAGFSWVDSNDRDNGVISFLRLAHGPEEVLLVICNCTAVPRPGYRVGVPLGGQWEEILNGDAAVYWGSGHGNYGTVFALPKESHGRPYSLVLTLPPLAVLILKLCGV